MRLKNLNHQLVSFEIKIALLVLFFGVSLSVVGFVELQAIAKERAYVEAENYARTQVEKIQTKLNISLDSLQRVAELYRTTHYLSESQLAALVDSDRQYHGATVGLAWVQRVQQANKEHYELQQQVLGVQPFQIFEQTGHGFRVENHSDADYFPVTVIYPNHVGEYSRGFNIASIPSRYRLLNKARQKKRTVISQQLSIYHQNELLSGFQAFHPLFSSDTNSLQKLEGFVLGIYDFSAFFEGSFQQDLVGLSIALYDGSNTSQQLLYQSGHQFEDVDSVKFNKNNHWTFPVIVADKQWVLAVFPNQNYDQKNWLPYFGLIGGSLITFLLAAYLFIALVRSRQVTELASDLVGTETQLNLQRQLKQQADQANFAKSQLLRAASHDLRQPMHTLGLLVGLLKNTSDENQRQQLTEKILIALDGMSHMFSALFEISLLDSGNVEVNTCDIAVQEYTDKLVLEFELMAEQKGLALSVIATSATVHTDPILFERILRNLLSNAVRYTEKGRIIIGCRRKQDYLRLCVIDTGIGLSKESQLRLFDEFYRDAQAKNISDHGLGIGLSIVQKTAQLLNINIGFNSILGKGSCFYVDLPYGTDPVLIKPKQQVIFKPLDVTIWLIEDDQHALMSLAKLLQSWGCEVSCFSNGQALRHRLAKMNLSPDLIVSDYQLKNETGIELIAMLRSQHQKLIPALVLTGDTDKKTKLQVENNDCDLMLKPASLHALYDWITRHIVQKD